MLQGSLLIVFALYPKLRGIFWLGRNLGVRQIDTNDVCVVTTGAPISYTCFSRSTSVVEGSDESINHVTSH